MKPRRPQNRRRSSDILVNPPSRAEAEAAWDFLAVHRALRDFHVFDQGNQKTITWVDDKRNEALSWVDPYTQFQRRSETETVRGD